MNVDIRSLFNLYQLSSARRRLAYDRILAVCDPESEAALVAILETLVAREVALVATEQTWKRRKGRQHAEEASELDAVLDRAVSGLFDASNLATPQDPNSILDPTKGRSLTLFASRHCELFVVSGRPGLVVLVTCSPKSDPWNHSQAVDPNVNLLGFWKSVN